MSDSEMRMIIEIKLDMYGLSTVSELARSNCVDALMSLFTEEMASTIAERGLKELCWKQKQDEYIACDRESNHIGLHSWEPKENK